MIPSKKPLRRSWLRRTGKKRRERTISWRSGRVRETAQGMVELRRKACDRSCGICECGRKVCRKRSQWDRRVSWNFGHLHHVISRAHGGSDVLENVQFITPRCHQEITGDLHWKKAA